MKEELVYLGVDIAKAHLDAAIGSEKGRFSYESLGHRQLIKWVKQLGDRVQVIVNRVVVTSANLSRRLRERE
jgi:hypothetical protein